MPRLTDPSAIRRLLNTDRAWSLYALGDLAPGYCDHAEWYGNNQALALLYRVPADAPVLITFGAPEDLAPLLAEVRDEPQLYLSIRPEILPLIQTHWMVRDETLMWRMMLEVAHFWPVPSGARRLTRADVPALQTLYADGAATGEAPDFFFPEMLDDGVFYGIEEQGALVAAAGTHLVSMEMGIGAVGNVYTRRDVRGRRLAAQTTSAVTAELLRMNISTIGLNVKHNNLPAQRAYTRLGYTRYCDFYEGHAVVR